ncbi:hypothetical protein GCM10027425_33490 [Alteromonas gracilis]
MSAAVSLEMPREAVADRSNEYFARWPAPRLVGLARSYGPLRAVSEHQAPVVRLAARHDRGVLPRWQRGGDGVHEFAEPGEYVGHRAWTSREHWLGRVVPAAIAAAPEVLRELHVSERLLHAWAEGISLYAHTRTGRRCIVRPDRLAELIGYDKRSVQRAQKAATLLGLYVVIRHGRMLTMDEVVQARQSGSRQRGLSNEAALVVPAHLTQTTRPRRLHPRLVTPTSGRNRHPSKLTVTSSFTRFARKNEPPPAAQQQPKRAIPVEPTSATDPGRATRRYDAAALDLARDLVRHISWLQGVAPGRLEPMLRRFANASTPWTASDVVAAVEAMDRRLGRASMTRSLAHHPVGLLASYLRTFDAQADHPHPDIDPTAERPSAPTRQQRINQARAEAAQMRRNRAPSETQRRYANSARDAARAARQLKEPPR